MRVYHIGAVAKMMLGVLIALVLYNFIHIYEDPGVGIGFGLVSVFLIAWGASFYVFWGINNVMRNQTEKECISDSYKMSLLFGLFCLLNVVLLLLSIRTKLLGSILIIGFLILYILLFTQPAKANHSR